VTRVTKEMHGELIHAATVEIKRTMRENRKKGSVIDRALAQAQRKNGNVVAMPKRGEAHTTPQIAAALDAGADRRLEADTGMDPRAAAEQARMIDEMSAEEIAGIYERSERVIAQKMTEIAGRATAHVPAEVARLPESPKQRYRRAIQMRQARERGETAGDFYDGIWLGRYEQSAEFKAQAAMHEDFGDAYLAP
jgi:23S rRNA pseudoU1915 N3-methylase RlmH